MKIHTFLTLTALTLCTPFNLAYAIDLTPEQEAKINALPPAYREQALQELEKLETSSQLSNEAPGQPTVVIPQSEMDLEIDEEEIGSELTTEEVPEEKLTDDQLEPYGYDLFAGSPTTFAPVTEIPIPTNYVLGPGDQVRVKFFGKETGSYDVYVTRDGMLQIPELGPISVTGLSFRELKEELKKRTADQMIGVETYVSLGELRSIRVFILGNVNRPGSYSVSSLSTLVNALFVSGGVKPIGSLRNIQLKRRGKTVATMDLYDLLLKGDTSGDAQLQPGDVIFVPPVGRTAGIAGEAKRPAIYELKDGQDTIASLIDLAAGLTSNAFPPLSQIERVGSNGLREILDTDLSRPEILETELRDGDILRVYGSLQRVDNVVITEGLVERHGSYQWREGIRVNDIIGNYDDVLPNADLQYTLLVRVDPRNGHLTTRSFSLETVFNNPSSNDNLLLQQKDRIIIFQNEGEREGLEEIVERLKLQATSSTPERVIEATGNLRLPDSYPLDIGMTVEDLIRAAGGFAQDAYRLEAELVRYNDNGSRQRESILIPMKLTGTNNDLGFKLQPFDQLLIRRIPDWSENETIVLEGEIRFPGTYRIERGEKLGSVIARAGGLTALAYPKAAVFARESLRLSEEEQIQKLKVRLEEDIKSSRLQEGDVSSETLETADELAKELESAQALGRLVIDLPKIINGDNTDVILRDGDSLYVPQTPQAVTIIGSVNYPTSHFYDASLSRDAYIALSGGILKRADKKRIYVVRANGQVVANNGSRFFPNSRTSIQPGDTIVVPVDIDKMKPLKYWGAVTQIIYNLALGAAAINSF